MACLKIELHDLVRAKRRVRGLASHDPKLGGPLPAFECRPILVNTASTDEKGCLVLADGRLVSVLVHVADTRDEQDRGKVVRLAHEGRLRALRRACSAAV